jgi:hypothetical protein
MLVSSKFENLWIVFNWSKMDGVAKIEKHIHGQTDYYLFLLPVFKIAVNIFGFHAGLVLFSC